MWGFDGPGGGSGGPGRALGGPGGDSGGPEVLKPGNLVSAQPTF